jgi:hypothetical protein
MTGEARREAGVVAITSEHRPVLRRGPYAVVPLCGGSRQAHAGPRHEEVRRDAVRSCPCPLGRAHHPPARIGSTLGGQLSVHHGSRRSALPRVLQPRGTPSAIARHEKQTAYGWASTTTLVRRPASGILVAGESSARPDGARSTKIGQRCLRPLASRHTVRHR